MISHQQNNNKHTLLHNKSHQTKYGQQPQSEKVLLVMTSRPIFQNNFYYVTNIVIEYLRNTAPILQLIYNKEDGQRSSSFRF